ncbi:Dps DNA-binding ferritin-like protein (oxidative damage protectant) [uncultured Caudovirales phage]|uniref:Dps DNA-binding ferritin-like protein (Oxidative damage protectant) n=1 Tax=uncultured Caudovirales phage TaxID=2100421 RepID=A0A6J5KR97_9CAUD|nr:Dps DNA-binding ferritin-like protein (oxidative damage protectant) [uncultured Caudovirales phage]
MKDLIVALKILFASNFVLYLKTHGAHVNVTGMFFPQLHELFGSQYEDLQDQIDTIAEKIRQLDEFAPMSMTEIAQQSAIEDFAGTADSRGYLSMLEADQEKMLVILHRAFELADRVDQDGIANYLQDRMDRHGKNRWQLRATQQR